MYILLGSTFVGEVQGSEREAALVDHLFYSYNPLIRPAQNASEVTRICFGMQLVQLINVDERNQVMKSNVWIRMRWVDYQLAWKPESFDNITVLRVCTMQSKPLL